MTMRRRLPGVTYARVSVFAGLLALVVVGSALADTPAPEVRLTERNADLKVGPGMDASGRCLNDCAFIGQDLRGANFSNCDFQGAILEDCNLSGTVFRGSSLKGLRVDQCRIEGADFTDAEIGAVYSLTSWLYPPHDLDLNEEQFKSTRSYQSRDLRVCVIPGPSSGKDLPVTYDFRNADLRGALLDFGDFSQCDFEGARIEGLRLGLGASIDFATLARARDFAGNRATLYGVNLLSGKVEGDCDFSGMQLSRFTFSARSCDSVSFEGSRLSQSCLSHLTSEHLQQTASYREGDLAGLTFENSDLRGCDFSRFDLSGATFWKCNLDGVLFKDSVISRAEFAECIGDNLEADLQTSWNHKHSRTETVKISDRGAQSTISIWQEYNASRAHALGRY
jgi:uncharacterized protein YjbI with pentapeptide repeats